MATTLRPGMDVCGSDGQGIGKMHRLFSAAAARGGQDPSDIDLDPNQGDHRHLGDVAPVYDAALLGTADYGSGQISGMAPFAATDASHTGAATPEGAMTFSPSDTKYMEVHHHGLLGLRHASMYVPLRAVDAISEHTITLSCTRDDAMRLYGDRPAPDEFPEG